MQFKQILKNYLSKKLGLSDEVKTLAGRQTTAILSEEGYIPINQTQDDDVFIIGFPKSGHTWMQYILTSLVFGIKPQDLRDSIVQEFVPDMHVRGYYRRYLERAFIKSHNLPSPQFKNVIYLVRDGRDAMVSYYHMLKKVTKHKVTLEEMIIADKEVFPCNWSEHVDRWLMSNPHSMNLLVVRYEDLLQDPLKELRRIMSFLSIERGEAFCREIIANTSIDILRKKAKELGLVHKVLNNPDGHHFFRLGQTGTYLTELSPDLIKVFETRFLKQLRFLNYSYGA